MKICTAGLIAYETAMRLYEDEKAAFRERFPGFFLREFEKLSEESEMTAVFLDNLCIEKNTKKLYSRKNFYYNGQFYVREIKEGGIFAALWAACEDLQDLIREGGLLDPECCLKTGHAGCSIRLQDIPLDQHVIELLEYRKENPYEVSSAGSYLVICGNIPEEYSVHLTEIGEITDSKDRLILSDGHIRFLTPPGRQAQDMADRRRGNEKG